LKEFPFDYAWEKVEELKGKTNVIKVELEDSLNDEKEKDEEWVEVKASTKKREKRNSESKTIVDKEVSDGLKEISVGSIREKNVSKVEESKKKTFLINVEVEKTPEEWVDVKSSAAKKRNKRKSESKTIVDNETGDALKEISVSFDPATGTVLEQTLIEGDYIHVAARPQDVHMNESTGKTNLIKVEIEETSKEKEEWVEVKSGAKKRNKRKSESKTIIDNEIANSMKEISVSMTKN